MAEKSLGRKLTTMFSDDVAEFSSLIGQDEGSTVENRRAEKVSP